MKQPIMRFDQFGDKLVASVHFNEKGEIYGVEVYFLSKYEKSWFSNYTRDKILTDNQYANTHGNLIGTLIFT